jgi:DNA primase
MSDADVKEQVKEATDIVEVIGQFVTLKRRGANYLGLCPFHTEKTPSFSVHGDRQFFHCFGCGKGGDVFTFLMEHEGWSFPEALKYCADRAGIRLPERRHPDDKAAQRREAILNALAMAGEIYRRALFASAGQAALDYLHQRGFQDSTLRRAGVGYAPNAYDTLINRARSRGVNDRALLEAGLVKESPRSDRPYDAFRNRIVFPIINLSGKTVGFGARTLSDDDHPKYLNSPETEVYHKSRILYGLHIAREAIRRAERAVIVEGYMDWLTMLEFGIENVVAVSGTALTEAQAKLLSRFCPRITLMYDADTAGQRAALRGIDIAINAGLAVDVVTLPEGDDPDSLLRRDGAGKLHELIRAAPGIVEYRIEQERSRSGALDFMAQEKLAKEFLALARQIGDATRRDSFISEVAGYLRIPEDRLRRGLGRVGEAQPNTSGLPAKLHDEQVFLRILFDDPRLLEEARQQVEPEDFEIDIHRRMFTVLLDRSAQGAKIASPQDLGPDADAVRLWAHLISHEVDPESYDRIFADILKFFRSRRLQHRRAAIKHEIEQARRAGNLEEVDRLLKERVKLDRKEG